MPQKRKQIYINKHIIKANKKKEEKDWEPPISVRVGRLVQRGYTVWITGASVVYYSPDKPLSCGAEAWIETYHSVVLFPERNNPDAVTID
jgi:hypothetical protein